MTNAVLNWLLIAITLLACSTVTLGLMMPQPRPHVRTLTMSTAPTPSATSLVSTTTTPSFASLVSLYDSYIIDQWGVLHDGKTPYTGVVACLRELKAAGKQLILLSNSSKRRSSSFKGLQKVGIDPTLFDDIVTSGELAWHLINDRRFSFDLTDGGQVQGGDKALSAPLKVFVIGNNDDDAEYITSCGCVAASPEEAQFVLARGTFSFMSSTTPTRSDKATPRAAAGVISYARAEDLMDAVAPVLLRCLARNLPMLVSNPDFHRPGSGAPMPGQIAQMYADQGGVVQYLGKPYARVYEECFAVIGRSSGGVDKTRICGVSRRVHVSMCQCINVTV